MILAVWGDIWADLEREEQAEGVLERCKRSGIDVYMPFLQRFGDRCVLAMGRKSEVLRIETTDLLGELAHSADRNGVQIEPVLLPFTPELLLDETDQQVSSRRYRPLSFDGIGDRSWGVKLFCPTWPENRARVLVKLNDLIECCGRGLTGIHLDAIRYSDAGGDGDWSTPWPCHCDACRKAYADLIGTETLTAEDLRPAGVRYKFMEFRNRCIRQLLEQIRDVTNRAGLRLTLAARSDFFGNALPEGQDWPQWARDGLLDVVYTMNYGTDRARRRRVTERSLALMTNRGKCLYCDSVGKKSSVGENTTEDLITFARESLAAGADGLTFFSYPSMTAADFDAVGTLKSV